MVKKGTRVRERAPSQVDLKEFKVLEQLLTVFGIGWLLLHHWLIWILGKVVIYEDNPVILGAEIIVTSGLSIYAVGRTAEETRRWRENGARARTDLY